MANESDRFQGRTVLEGAFAVLEVIRDTPGVIGLTRLSTASGLPKTTVHRLLDQLIGLGAVERVPGGYRIGPLIFQLGQGWQPYPRMREAVNPALRGLAMATSTSVVLATARQDRILIAAASPNRSELAEAASPGTPVTLDMAAGKLLAAFDAGLGTPAEQSDRVWRRTRDVIRDSGLAFDREEVISGIACVATPVYGPSGRVVAALTAMTTADRPLAGVSEAVRHAARSLGRALSA